MLSPFTFHERTSITLLEAHKPLAPGSLSVWLLPILRFVMIPVIYPSSRVSPELPRTVSELPRTVEP